MTITQAVILRTNELLAKNNMNRHQLSERANLPSGTISSIYKQLSNGVSLSTILALSRGFGITMKEFLNSPLFDNLEDDGKKSRKKGRENRNTEKDAEKDTEKWDGDTVL